MAIFCASANDNTPPHYQLHLYPCLTSTSAYHSAESKPIQYLTSFDSCAFGFVYLLYICIDLQFECPSQTGYEHIFNYISVQIKCRIFGQLPDQ